MRLLALLISMVIAALAAHAQAPVAVAVNKDGRYTEHIDKETDIEMIYVPEGNFEMGSNDYPSEQPIHHVHVTGYYISRFEITQQQWYAVLHWNYSHYDQCPNCPVESVNWNDVQEYLTTLSRLTGKCYRLPTEAEWEYAARGGNRSRHFKYSGSNDYRTVAWVGDHYLTDADKTRQVGLKEGNELGICDMNGNVLEWCSDWYDSTYYAHSPVNNPKGPAAGKYKVVRGGCYFYPPQFCTNTYRETSGSVHEFTNASTSSRFLGFRVVREQ